MSNGYLEQAARGQNRWWRYLLTLGGIGLGVLAFNIPYTILMAAVAKRMPDAGFRLDPVKGVVGALPFPLFAAGLLAFAAVLGALAFSMRKVHRRPFRSLIGADDRFRVRPYLKALGASFAVVAAMTLLNVAIDGEAFRWNFEPGAFLLALAVTAVLLPIQASTEELLYRGWLSQGVFQLTGRRWAAVAVSSVLFALSHASNPEAGATPLITGAYYVAVGVLLSVVTLRTQRLETAMGIHTAVNLVGFLIASPSSMFLKPVSLFVDVQPNSLRDLAMIAVLGALAWRATRSKGSTVAAARGEAVDEVGLAA